MAIYRKGNRGKYYMAFVAGGRRILKSTGADDKDKALQIEEDEKRRLRGDDQTFRELPSLERATSMTLLEAIERGYQERWIHRRDGKTTKNRLLHIAAALGDVKLEGITHEHIQRVIVALEHRGITLSTINRHLAHLKTLINMAEGDWRIRFKDRPKIKCFPVPEPRKRVVGHEEEERIIKTLREGKHRKGRSSELRPAMADLIEVLVRTGMRLGEALSLTYQKNIDFEREALHLFGDNTKSARPRSIPANEKVKEVLLRRREKYPDRPFPYRVDALTRVFHRLRIELDYPKDDHIGFHAFRHTFASRLLEVGEDIMTIKELLGHSTVEVTQMYLHLSLDKLRSAVNKLR